MAPESRRPRLLDLFCGAGGAAMGYHRAGFEVVGVDLEPQPHYPFAFVQADALEAIEPLVDLLEIDAVHASPPCQGYSTGIRSEAPRATPRLIAATRDRLRASGRPYVIENVVGARIGAELMSGLFLCGTMFDRPVSRHRLFESSELLWSPGPHECRRLAGIQRGYPIPKEWDSTSAGNRWRNRAYGVTGHSRGRGCLPFWRDLMGMPWAVTAHEMSEAIPPAYTEWIGAQLIARLAPTVAGALPETRLDTVRALAG